MDQYKLQQGLLISSMDVVGDASALVDRIKKITSSEHYLRLMKLAEDSSLYVPSMDLEMSDLEKSLKKFTDLLMKAHERASAL